LLILIGGTIFVHPPTEGVVTALAALYLAALMAEALAVRRYRAATNLVAAVGVRMLIPIIVLGVWLPSVSKSTLERAVAGDPGISRYLGFNAGFFEAFGVIAVALFVWGIFIFVLDRRYGLRTYVLPVLTVFLLLFLNFVYPRYQLGPSILYERGWSYLGLFMAILAGYGVASFFRSVPALSKSMEALVSHRFSGWTRVICIGVGIAVVAAALTTGLFNEQRGDYARYYHMMDDQVYADFVWLGQHTAPGHKVVMMEPSLAWAYPPIAGPGNMVSGAASAPFRTKWAKQVREVLITGNVDTEWLRQQGVSVLYTGLPGSQKYAPIKNSELLEVRPGVYLVPAERAGEH
jgi:hypothetical protein